MSKKGPDTFSAAVYHSSLTDINGDRRPDLVLQFRVSETTLLDSYQSLIAGRKNFAQ